MFRKFLLAPLAIFCFAGQASASAASVDEMNGYEWYYVNCTVSWDAGAKDFKMVGEWCKSAESRVSEDAERALAYMRDNSNANSFADMHAILRTYSDSFSQHEAVGDASLVWAKACKDFKAGRDAQTTDFRKYMDLRGSEVMAPRIKENYALEVYLKGWEASRLDPSLNCDLESFERTQALMQGIELRKGR